MSAAPPQNETGRAFARPAALNTFANQKHGRVNARGLRRWLEVAGDLVELAQSDPDKGLRYLETWARHMRRGLGHPVHLASLGGNHR